MSEYMCDHGQLYMSCPICVEITRAQSEMMPDFLDVSVEEVNEYIYDYYLHEDERQLREEESK